MKICIQAGHFEAQLHTISSLRKSTGAPGEVELTRRITERLGGLLVERGFEILVVNAGAYSSPVVRNTDWDLFISLHGDADSPNGSGGCIGFPHPSTDYSTKESQRLAKVIGKEYFHHSEIENRPNKITNNIRHYYMWRYLSAKTPCVLLEMGEVQDAHDKILLADTNRIASAIARGICAAFDVPFDGTPGVSTETQISDLKDEINSLSSQLATTKKECQEKIQKVGDCLNNIRDSVIAAKKVIKNLI